MIETVYADNAATTQLDPEVFDAMAPFLKDNFGNPSSLHWQGRNAKLGVEKSRKTIARLLGAQPNQIIFTGSGTEANNTAIASSLLSGHCKKVITSPVEHHAVLHTIDHYSKLFNVPQHFVRLKSNAAIDTGDLEKLLTQYKDQCLVSLMHANNEIGNISDIKSIGELCRRHGGVYHADCVQTVGHYQMNVSELPIDFMSASAHKFHGPKGTGLLFARQPEKLTSLIHGGGQEKNHRAGTENVAGIVGMAKALELAMQRLNADRLHIQSLKTRLIETLKEKITGIGFNGDISLQSLYTVLNVSFPLTEKTEGFVTALDMEGICVSGGSACTGGAASHVITAIAAGHDRATVRFSFSRCNTLSDVTFICNTIEKLVL